MLQNPSTKSGTYNLTGHSLAIALEPASAS